MKTWKQAPLDQVIAQYIECYWLLEYKQRENNAVPPVLLPNPNAHLVITPADAIHHYRVKPNRAQPAQAQAQNRQSLNKQVPSDRNQMLFCRFSPSDAVKPLYRTT